MQASKLKERGIHEAKLFLGMFVYLFIMFGLMVVHESMVLAQHQINYVAHGVAVINALVMAKVMLVAEDLHVGRRFEERPLAISVLFKSVVFAAVFICFRIVEDVVIGLFHGKTVAESVPGFGGGGLAGILSTACLTTFALMPFFAFTEVGRVIGEAKLRALFLTRGAKSVEQGA